MTNKEPLGHCINLFSEEEISSLLDDAILMTTSNVPDVKPDCPYCSLSAIILYGEKYKKQRLLCKSCGKTFVTTTHTFMANFHFPIGAWREAIRDTICGIYHIAQKLAAFTKWFSV